MKPTLKSKTEELLQEKFVEIGRLSAECDNLKAKFKSVRKESKFATTGKMQLEKAINDTFNKMQTIHEFTTDLKVLLNWA